MAVNNKTLKCHPCMLSFHAAAPDPRNFHTRAACDNHACGKRVYKPPFDNIKLHQISEVKYPVNLPKGILPELSLTFYCLDVAEPNYKL